VNDIVDQIQRTHRELTSGRIPAGDGRAVILRRTYRADIEDVWQACTDPERLSRWFLQVTVAPKVGGHYQLEGNAGGEILRCDPPRLLAVTWVFGENITDKDISEVEVRLTPRTVEIFLKGERIAAHHLRAGGNHLLINSAGPGRRVGGQTGQAILRSLRRLGRLSPEPEKSVVSTSRDGLCGEREVRQWCLSTSMGRATRRMSIRARLFYGCCATRAA